MLGLLSQYTNAAMDGVQFIVAGHHFKVPDSETSACNVVRKDPRSVHHWPNFFVVCGGYIVLGACHVRKKPESLALANRPLMQR